MCGSWRIDIRCKTCLRLRWFFAIKITFFSPQGFPRTPLQAEALLKSEPKPTLVLEIAVSRHVAKQRIMGRRLCVADSSHQNHVAVHALKPIERGGKLLCRVCEGNVRQ